MMVRWLRVVVPVLLLVLAFASFQPRVGHAQGMLPITVTTAVMQVTPTNTGGAPHELRFAEPPRPDQRLLRDSTWMTALMARRFGDRTTYLNQPQVLGRRTMGIFRAWACVGLTLCKPAHDATASAYAIAWQESPPFSYTDPATGNVLSVDANGNVVMTDAQGELLLEFTISENYFGDPIVQTEGEDGTAYRESLDAYSVEIDPQGDDCIVSNGEDEFPMYVDEDGFLVYEDENGYVIAFEQGEDGVLYTEDSEGMFGEFYEGGQYAFFDEDGNVVDEGEIENPTLDDRSRDLGFDLLDEDSEFYDEEALLDDTESGDNAGTDADGDNVDTSGEDGGTADDADGEVAPDSTGVDAGGEDGGTADDADGEAAPDGIGGDTGGDESSSGG